MRPVSEKKSLEIAKAHLGKVMEAWAAPTDWSDLAMYGFYCLEAAVMAAAAHIGTAVQRSHPDKIRVSELLRDRHGLPDISQLLSDLNVARKAAAYGDVDFPTLDPEQLAAKIERYVDAVEVLLQT